MFPEAWRFQRGVSCSQESSTCLLPKQPQHRHAPSRSQMLGLGACFCRQKACWYTWRDQIFQTVFGCGPGSRQNLYCGWTISWRFADSGGLGCMGATLLKLGSFERVVTPVFRTQSCPFVLLRECFCRSTRISAWFLSARCCWSWTSSRSCVWNPDGHRTFH